MLDWNKIKYFKPSEFDSPDLPGSGKNMQQSTIEKLERARSSAGVPFGINSGYRTQKHNDSLEHSVKDSAHRTGHAADIAVTKDTYGKILTALINAGFKRIGLGRNFIHVDDDPTKPTPAVWIYHKTSKWENFRVKVLNIIKKKVTVKMQLASFYSWEVPS